MKLDLDLILRRVNEKLLEEDRDMLISTEESTVIDLVQCVRDLAQDLRWAIGECRCGISSYNPDHVRGCFALEAEKTLSRWGLE